MRITCPNCSAQYEVDASLFPEEGREVQCSTCENIWVQGPEVKEAPLRLDQPAPMPSEALSDTERSALQAAVDQEISIRDSAPSRGPDPAAEPAPDEEDILSALREQIAIEGGDFEDKDGPALSQKRNLRKAAEAVGIEVEVDPVEQRREAAKQKVSSNEQDDSSRRKLASVLEEYESLGSSSRSSGLRSGFIAAVVLCAVGLGTYVGRDALTDLYPPVGPYLDTYATYVDKGRDQVESLYQQYGAGVIGDLASDGTE